MIQNALVESSRPSSPWNGLDEEILHKELCKKSLKYLCREVLHYQDWSGCHDQLEAQIEEWDIQGKRMRLILMPRGHLKTSILTIGRTIQDILRNPNIKILLASAVWGNARSFLAEIRQYLTRNGMLTSCFGRFESDSWTQDAITINQRVIPNKTATVDTAGIEKIITSQHYDIIRADDLVTRETVATREQIEKVRNFFNDLLKLLEPNGVLEVIGTRWHDADLYGVIIRELCGERMGDDAFVVYKRAAIEDGKVIFPQKFSQIKLDNLKGQIGTYEFSCNFENDPINPESQHFKKPFRYWTNEHNELIHAQHTGTVDLAISEKTAADYSVVMDCAITPANQLWVVDYWRKQGASPYEIIDRIFSFAQQYKWRRVGIESVAYQRALIEILKEEQRKRNIFFEVVPIIQIKDKFTRILALQPRWESGNLLIKQGMVELEEELSRFPVGEHDDLIDALAMQLQVMTPQVGGKDRVYIPPEHRRKERYAYQFL